MTDSPGAPSALGIEAVEYLQEGGNVTVRVTGRWRRRRPDWRGPAVLIIEADGMRHRFPAMPEPPSLSGALPGTWRMSFSVAAELASQLGGRAWLQLGSAAVPLPLLAEDQLNAAAEEATAHRVARSSAPETLVARELRGAEVAAQSARRRAAQAEADVGELLIRIQQLEQALDRALEEPERLDALLSEARRRRRAAEQRAQAEAALRIEAEEQLAEDRRALLQALARARAPQVRVEFRLLAASRDSPPPVSAPGFSSTSTPAPALGLAGELQMLARRGGAGEAAGRRAAALERALGEERRRWAGAARGLEELRHELDELRQAYAGWVPVDWAREAPADRAREAPAPAREPKPAPVRAPAPTPAPPGIPAGRTLKPWLPPIFRTLVKADPIAAGRLVLALLPAQRAVHPGPVAYDLVLGESSCVRVTVDDGPPQIEYAPRPRPEQEVQFSVEGDLGQLARLVASGRVRERLGREVARVHGERSAAAALRALVESPLSLRRLHALGVRVDAGLALALCAGLLKPAWTAGERFTIAHRPVGAPQPGFHLRISDGETPVVLDQPPAEGAGTTIVCPGDALLEALAGARGGNVFVRGDHRPAELISEWLEQAQCV